MKPVIRLLMQFIATGDEDFLSHTQIVGFINHVFLSLRDDRDVTETVENHSAQIGAGRR